MYHVLDLFCPYKFGRFMRFLRFILVCGLYSLSAYLFYETFTMDFAVSNVWAELYFFYIVVNIIVQFGRWLQGKELDEDLKIRSNTAEFTKETNLVEKPRDLNLSDDIYCISFLSYYYLNQKQEIKD